MVLHSCVRYDFKDKIWFSEKGQNLQWGMTARIVEKFLKSMEYNIF